MFDKGFSVEKLSPIALNLWVQLVISPSLLKRRHSIKRFLILRKRFFDRVHDTLTFLQVRAILFARHVNIHQEIEVAGGDESRRGLDPFEPVVSIPAEIIQFV